MVTDIAQRTLVVGLGELYVSRAPGDTLVAYGLGSCVAVGLYDAQTQTGGLLHAVLPHQQVKHEEDLVARYVDSGILALIYAMQLHKADYARQKVWLVGGASILLPGANPTRPLDIGERNVATARTVLQELGFTLQAQAVGGQHGRTVRLYVGPGRLTVRQLGAVEQPL